MDSLSQIVLGAAVGEAVLGKKIGNRALALGALAGTIPDLDILANPFLSEMQAMDFHRGISHSILFTVLAPLVGAGISHWFYARDIHHRKGYRLALGILPLLGILFVGGIAAYAAITTQSYLGLAISVILALALATPIGRYIFRHPSQMERPRFMDWYWFFFWCFGTHILLDVFTTYGTQVFQPFSNVRVTFSAVSVVDPLYTLPLVLSCLLVSLVRRKSKVREWINGLGLILSSLYLLLAVFNKTQANDAVKHTLAEKGLQAERYLTSPTLFNSLLWSSTVELDSNYLLGSYSVLDQERGLHRAQFFPKNHHLLQGHENDEHPAILRRFSDGYYMLREGTKPGSLEFIDLRWGTLSNMTPVKKEDEFPIVFILEKKGAEYVVTGEVGERKEDENKDFFQKITGNLTRLPNILSEFQQKYPNFFKDFWHRIMGQRN